MANDSFTEYYTAIEHLSKLYDKESRKMGLKANSIEEYTQWKDKVRTILRDITGMNRMESCPLSPKLISSEKFDTYSRDKVIIQTEPDVWMPIYILKPNNIKKSEKRPCIIATHGHSSGGKAAVVGRSDIEAIGKQIERRNWDYGVKFVQQGYVVFCPDARGFGERREWMNQDEKSILSSSCNALNRIAISLGQSVTGMWVWDLMRLLDFIQTSEYVDPNRIGCAGLSGGGLQVLWLTALDDRVKCSITSGYFYGNKDSLFKIIGCSCNYVPHL